jgi:circadian clock protein KaiC
LKAGRQVEAEAMLARLIDFLKAEQITGVFTSLTHSGHPLEETELGVSSLIDVWILLRDIELGGERNRGMYVLKSRGMAHSNQIREFLLTSHGIELRDVYVGPEGVLTGSMRLAQESREEAAAVTRLQDVERRRRELERKRQTLEAQMALQRAQFEAEAEELSVLLKQEELAGERLEQDRKNMAESRKADDGSEYVSRAPRTKGSKGERT